MGLFDETMRDGCEDWDIWISLVERGHKGVIIPRFLFQYRRRKDSMSWSMTERHLKLFGRLIQKHEASYRTHLPELFQRRELAICDLRPWYRSPVVGAAGRCGPCFTHGGRHVPQVIPAAVASRHCSHLPYSSC